MKRTEKVIHLAATLSGPARLITAQSYLIDRFQPDCEIIALPPKPVGGGEIALTLGPLQAAAPVRPERLPRLARRLRPPPVLAQDGILFDLRDHAPGNWAHFLDNHIPFVVFACRTFGLALADCRLLLPAATPGYILEVAALFGLAVLCSDATVTGSGVTWRMDNWPVIRAARMGWVQDPEIRSRIDGLSAATALPPRLFLPRRRTRHLENQAEIEALLAARGFLTLYPEDLSPADQFRLFEEAEIIVAVHGAGLAPLLYRSPHSKLRQLVEILPVGHMTDVYRMMAEQLGLGWIGVRGRIRPEHVAPAYDLTQPFRKFSLAGFSADPRALLLALDLAEEGRTGA
jgi:capsular polysaccharide biosynthesis protein